MTLLEQWQKKAQEAEARIKSALEAIEADEVLCNDEALVPVIEALEGETLPVDPSAETSAAPASELDEDGNLADPAAYEADDK